jgi:uncharacterized membrane protein
MTNKDGLEAHHTEFAEFQEGYVRHYISLADTKAAVVFGICTSLLAYVLSNDEYRKFLGDGFATFTSTAAIGVGILLLIAASLSAWVVIPRLPRGAEGIVFFGAVRNFKNGQTYRAALSSCSEAQLTSARIDHCYTTSKVCWRKYMVLRAAIWCSIVGIVLLGILLPSITK